MADLHVNRAFVIGWPIKHSRSPLIHNYWLKELGLEGEYVKQSVEPSDLPSFFDSVRAGAYLGGNVTIPHKEMAYRAADRCDAMATRLQAANTLWVEDGLLCASNTDGFGFAAAISQSQPDWISPERLKRGALVLGAGGASRAIVASLIDQGFETVWINNRTHERAVGLANFFGEPCAAISQDNLTQEQVLGASLIVNTTAIGMEGSETEGDSPIDLSPFSTDLIVNDIIYTPMETPLLAQANMLGMRTVDGLGMLLHQAVPGFEKWFGKRPTVNEALREHVLNPEQNG